MKYFYTVTVPHKDILEGKLTLDVLLRICGKFTGAFPIRV